MLPLPKKMVAWKFCEVVQLAILYWHLLRSSQRGWEGAGWQRGWLPCRWMAFESLGLFEHRISGLFWKGKNGKKPQFLERHVEGFCVFFFEVEKWNITQNRRSWFLAYARYAEVVGWCSWLVNFVGSNPRLKTQKNPRSAEIFKLSNHFFIMALEYFLLDGWVTEHVRTGTTRCQFVSCKTSQRFFENLERKELHKSVLELKWNFIEDWTFEKVTLLPIGMEVENGSIVKVYNYCWRDPFFTSMSMEGRVCSVCNHVNGRILQELSQMYRTLQFWEKAQMCGGAGRRGMRW